MICIKNLRRLFKGEPNDPFGQRDAKHNRSENAYRVADVIYQAESFMAHESDQVNEHIGKTEQIAANHPIPVLDKLISPSFDDGNNRGGRPIHIHHVKGYADGLPTGRMRCHIA